MLKRILFSFGIILYLGNNTFAQFSDAGNSFPAIASPESSWADIDSDGDLDLLYANSTNIYLYKNNGSGVFTSVTTNIAPVSFGSYDWGDFDNDGDMDVLVTGTTYYGSYYAITRIYANNGSGVFTVLPKYIQGLDESSGEWGDYDNDGWLDFVVTGYDLSTFKYVTSIYKNNHDGSFTLQTGINIIGIGRGAVSWGDYNNDGKLDLLITGLSGDSNIGYTNITKLFTNNGNNTFTENKQTPFLGVAWASVSWGDYTNDGYLDFVLTGQTGQANGYILKIYRNNGDGSFENTVSNSTAVKGASIGSAAWGDCDNDGDLDLIASGQDWTGSTVTNNTIVYEITGAYTLTPLVNPLLTGIFYGTTTWADVDNDGDLDFFMAGNTSNTTYVAKLYKNYISIGNSVPSAPTGLTTQLETDGVIFKWNKSVDSQTTSNGLSYNLYLFDGTTNKNIDAPNSYPKNHAMNGRRLIAKYGNIRINSSYKLKIPSKNYHWAVQAIDPSMKGGPFAYSRATKSNPIITWKSPADINYGTVLDNTQLNATATLPGTFIYTPSSGTILNVGNNQNLSVDFTPTDTAYNNNISKTVQINVIEVSS